MKGLILCAGKGTRMRPLTYAIPKQMIPVANKPVVHYAFEAMRDIGIRDLGIVVSDNRKDIEPHLGDGGEWGMKFTYIDQQETLGIAHAVMCAEDFIGGDDFLLYLGDNLLEHGLSMLRDEHRAGGSESVIVLKEVSDPEHFGVAVVEGGRIVSIEEKPQEPKSNLAVIGVYIFSARVFEAAKKVKPSWRGELEITDTIQELINLGCGVTPCVLEGWWKDTGRKDDMIDANRAVLDSLDGSNEGDVSTDSELAGKVIVGKGAEIESSRIEGPAIIGEGVRISGAAIGPYTSIDSGAKIENAGIENSIVMSGARISGVSSRIENSLIGSDAVIEKAAGDSGSITVTVSDKCHLILQ